MQNGHCKYSISWSGFPLEDSTWVQSPSVNEHVKKQNGHCKYLISWSGFPLEDSTWVQSPSVNEHVKK